jgi:phenylalanyl-tRNA synthetase alpha chain
LNFRPGHPAIEMHDTIYVDKMDTQWEELILRTHTSAAQNILMKKYGVPCRVCIPSRVYRFEDLDASHDTMFMQVEWFVIDAWISIAHFKHLIWEILNAVFERNVQVRMRPWYFPFVEPWFEIDASCPICESKGCSLCKQTWWIEIMGAGMIHPNVLREANIDSEQYSGFAFGMWINRMCAIKYGIKDIRLFTNGDIRFVQSFE